jgi:hypothetical protein
MLTPSSSAAVISFPSAVPEKFEPWREAWVRPILADPKLGYVAKLVACFILWYLNRQTRDCFPSYQTIADGIGVDRRTAIRGVAELKARGYLQRQSRGKGQSNLYSPSDEVVSHQTLGSVTPDTSASVTPDTLTSVSLTSESNRRSSALSESADNGTKIQQESAGETSPPRNTGTKKNGSAALAFEGEVIRVTAKQLERWRRAFPLVPDIVAELQAADDYFVAHPKDIKPFWRASAWLRRTNEKRLEAKSRSEAEAEDLSF